MTPREKEAAFSPLSMSADETTGLPTVLWAENLGCGLRKLSCYKCMPTRVSNENYFVALEVVNDSEKVTPPLKKGEILFPRQLIRICSSVSLS